MLPRAELNAVLVREHKAFPWEGTVRKIIEGERREEETSFKKALILRQLAANEL